MDIEKEKSLKRIEKKRERESKRDTDNSPPITNFATKLDT